MIWLVGVVGLIVLAHAVVGQRAIDNALRLQAALFMRLGIGRRPVPRSQWRHVASFLLSLVYAPFTGIFIAWLPLRRRAVVALIAVGASKAAWQRGAICEHELMAFDAAATSWCFRFGEALPEGREIPNIEQP